MNFENTITTFQISDNLIRGNIVRLSTVASDIINRHNYPTKVKSLLCETLALTTCIGSKIKNEGVFTFQAKGDGVINTLFSDIDQNLSLRGYVSLSKKKRIDISNTFELLGNGHLAFTIKESKYSNNYQGIVNLEGKSLKDSVENYFNSSEQLVTKFKIFNIFNLTENNINYPAYFSGSIMLQKMPENERSKLDRNVNLDEKWKEAIIFLKTMQEKEFFENHMTSNEILFRLFSQLNVKILKQSKVNSNCRCSKEKLIDLLKVMKKNDLKEIFKNKNVVDIVCEFCKKKRVLFKKDLKL